jgi:protocatechuate 3,4-dioxygenase, beta subunit
MPEIIYPVDTSSGWSQPGQKIRITGIIYESDGKTPAPDVTLYYYHTDINGLYADRKELDRRVVRHGYIRSWVKSDTEGKYSIYTVRPAPYPDRSMPAHIHPAIKEPDINKEYYIDEFVFVDDPLLTKEVRNAMENRGGNGILTLREDSGITTAQHNIILGKNIPNYPK